MFSILDNIDRAGTLTESRCNAASCPSSTTPLAFLKRYCRASSCNSRSFFFLSSKSDHCRGVIRGMSYKVTGEGKELRCCLPHWAPSCFFHLLCRATDDGRRRRIAPRVVVPYTVGRKRGKKRGG